MIAMRTSARGGALLGIVAVLIGLLILAALVLPYAFSRYMVKQLAENNPGMSMKPVPLPEVPMTEAKGTVLQNGDFEFTVPWGPLEGHDTSDYSDSFRFAHLYLVVNKGPAVMGFFGRGPDGNPQQAEAIKKAYGFEVPEEPYDAAKFLLEQDAKPPQFFIGTKGFVAVMLVSMKASLLLFPTNAIYSFTTDHARGFQINDPARMGQARQVRLHVFLADKKHFDLTIHMANSGPPLTQSEVSFIARSIRPAAAKPAPTEKPAPRLKAKKQAA